MNKNISNPQADWKIYAARPAKNFQDLKERNFLASFRVSCSPLGSLVKTIIVPPEAIGEEPK